MFKALKSEPLNDLTFSSSWDGGERHPKLNPRPLFLQEALSTEAFKLQYKDLYNDCRWTHMVFDMHYKQLYDNLKPLIKEIVAKKNHNQ